MAGKGAPQLPGFVIKVHQGKNTERLGTLKMGTKHRYIDYKRKQTPMCQEIKYRRERHQGESKLLEEFQWERIVSI